MRILFLNQNTGADFYPLAPAMLAASVIKKFGNKVSCTFIELQPSFNVQDTLENIKAVKPDVVALTFYLWSTDTLSGICSELTEIFSENNLPFVIAGGPEVSGSPGLFQSMDCIDLALPGEGEEPFSEIIEKLMPFYPGNLKDAAAGINFPKPYPAKFIENINDLTFPLEIPQINFEYRSFVWELTRGCPYNCHFCFESRGSGKVRHKSLTKVKKELDIIKKTGINKIFLLDPTFNALSGRSVELLNLFISESPGIKFYIEARGELINEKQAEYYGKLDCVLQIGLQTSNSETAGYIGRSFNKEKFLNGINLLNIYGVTFGLDLIYGLPGDNFDGFMESLDFALNCLPNHLDIFPLSVLPGTVLSENALNFGLNYMGNSPYTVRGTETENIKGKFKNFSPHDIEKASDISNAVNELYNRGRAVPWLVYTAGILDLKPSDIISYYADFGPAENNGESGFIVHLRNFIKFLCTSSGGGNFSLLLADIAVLFTVESALRLNLKISDPVYFNYCPSELLELLNNGIDDPEEIRFFVSENPGYYNVLNRNSEEIVFDKLKSQN